MSKKNYRGNTDYRDELRDEFEDFGYNVKNVKRSAKKKVTKFKREVNDYDDSYWSVHYLLTGHWSGVL